MNEWKNKWALYFHSVFVVNKVNVLYVHYALIKVAEISAFVSLQINRAQVWRGKKSVLEQNQPIINFTSLPILAFGLQFALQAQFP